MPKCQVCLEGDDARKGGVNQYQAPEDRPAAAGGSMACAFKVGYNEWDEDE
ncbi:MAG: hypothetical protein IPK85_02765 [Gemmatimonadetes bacterium]|nr:hypothetical protein [Gemmatimonadota bacterium]